MITSSIKAFFYWGVGALALIALADPYPTLATGLAILLIVGVVLTHYQQYGQLLGGFSAATKGQ